MAASPSASNITTHYYKMAHLGSINYFIYSTTNNNDQWLLELELLIRYNHPKILVTYHNKSLYYFTLGSEQASYQSGESKSEEETNGSKTEEIGQVPQIPTVEFDPAKEYPNLQLKHSSTINIEQIASSQSKTGAAAGATGSTSGVNDEYIPFASFSFLKAFKKMVHYNLSAQGYIKIFGNYSIIQQKEDPQKYSLLYIEPSLHPNGDLLLSVMLKNQLTFFDSSIFSAAAPPSLSYNGPSDFVIYLIPSGIRCHLFDPANFKKNLITRKHNLNENLLNLIKLSTGIDYTHMMSNTDEMVWIKLIPNLKHLNNQTSSIAKFVHSVENKKFILWPWNLCLIQLGKYEEVSEFSPSQNSTNPLSLISSFLDFSISSNQSLNQPAAPSFNAYSAISSGIGSVGPIEPHQKVSSVEMIDIGTPIYSTDFFEDKENGNNVENGIDLNQDSAENQNATMIEGDVDAMEIDDLFGDDDESDENMDEAEPEKEEVEQGVKDENQNLQHNENDIRAENPDQAEIQSQAPLAKQEELRPLELFDFDAEARPPPKDVPFAKFPIKAAYIDIPKDMMLKKLNTPDYNDPGAPLPMMPTPYVPQSVPNQPNFPDFFAGSANQASSSNSDSHSISQSTQNALPKSVFSPIIFNPIIKSDIDTKYGKGGKFYVDKESTLPEIEKKRRNIRATSVSGFELAIKDVFRDDILSNRVIEDESFESSEESDADEVMVDENAVSSTSPSKRAEDNFFGNFAPGVISSASKSYGLNSSGANGIQNSQQSSHTNSIQAQSITNTSTSINSNNSYAPEKGNLILGSPGNHFNRLSKSESPFFSDLTTVSPIDYDVNNQATPGSQNQSHPWSTPGPSRPVSTVANANVAPNSVSSPTVNVTTTSNEDPLKTISESTNYLPLILRSINVITIPNVFLLNNLIGSALLPNFNVDDEENDLELVKRNEMIVKIGHLDEFLAFLGPNLVFDLGLNKPRSKMRYYSNECPNTILSSTSEFDSATDNSGDSRDLPKHLGSSPVSSSTLKNHPIDYVLPSQEFEQKFFELFPNSHKVNLAELLIDYKSFDNDLESQLSFLDDIDDMHNPKSQYKTLKSIEWDSMSTEEGNREAYLKYKSLSEQFIASSTISDEQFFKLPVVKARVSKKENIVNLNHLAVNFWKFLNFSPIKAQKNFQVLLISEQDNSPISHDFLSQLIYNYQECHLGHVTKVNLSTVETRPDLESIANGLLLVNRASYNDVYTQIDRKLNSLVELIKLDLINKTNNFEFDRPLLLLFINFNESFNSVLQISKIFRNFNVALTNHQLPLVNIFTKVIPGSFLVKKHGSESKLKYLSNFKLSKLSMNLYNLCPNDLSASLTKNIYTQLVKEPPSKISFKFMNSNLKDNNFSDDLFLHLAYERSIDKHWCSAAWSDPLGSVTYTKSWYSTGANPNSSSNREKNAYDLSAICDNIWSISSELFKALNEEQGKGSVMSGKKFLVLARVNNILLDDELVHWKRLSLKHRDISMIVLTVNDLPQLLFSGASPQSRAPRTQSTFGSSMSAGSNSITAYNAVSLNSASQSAQPDNFFRTFTSNNSSPNNASHGLMTSPSGGINFHSPQQFLNVPGNFLSPQDATPSAGTFGGSGGAASSVPATGAAVGNTSDLRDSTLSDPASDLIGIVPKLPLSLFNHSTRLGMKTGYLLKELGVESDHQLQQSQGSYLVLDINLLSCSSYWDLDTLMRLILNHYKKLTVLNDMLGLRDMYGDVNHTDEDTESELSHEITQIVPWHILAVSKSLAYISHILVEE